MPLVVACFAAVASLSSCSDGKGYESVKGDPMQTRIYTLDNGLKVYLSVNKAEPKIQTFIAVRTGSKNDPAETTGLAHYLEHLMFKGTSQFGTNNPEAEAPLLDEIEQRYEVYRTTTDEATRKQLYHEIDSVSQLAAKYFIPNEYDKLMAAIGSEGSNAFTSNDVTCYVEEIPANEVENWAKIQADRFQNMVIRGFHTELEAVYEEYNIGLSNDGNKQFEALLAKLFPSHPYGTQTTIGTQQHLKNPSITNIKNYFAKWYVPNNVAICMAGDFDPDQVLATLKQYFGEWKPGDDVAQPTFPELEPMTAPVDTTVLGLEAESIWLGWRSEKASSLQNDTLELINSVLSNGKAGLLDLDLNQEMKVMVAQSGVESMMDYGFFLLVGMPKEGQSLDEVKDLMLGEIEKLKQGDFDDDLLVSALNNAKLDELRSLDQNRTRTYKMMEAFITGTPWQQQVGRMDRLAKITKQEVVDFANRFFGPGFVSVYKRQGEDTTQKKIDKPAITPIPTNRDQMSQFVRDIQNAQVEPIQPKFVDFKSDLTFAQVRKDLPLLYVQNKENGLFQLNFRFEFGRKADNRYSVATDYLDYLGTDKYTASQIKQKFYELGCDFYVGEGSDAINIRLSGLSENMQSALQLAEEVLQNLKVDKEAYNQMVAQTIKQRNDLKKNQRYYFNQLYYYGVFGPRNFTSDVLSEKQLKETDPQTFVDLLKNLSGYQHSVEYYGPMSAKEVSAIVSKLHKAPKQLKPVPANKEYERQLANKNEVWIAPYDAKNIYMRMLHDEHRSWNIDETATQSLFNEYFGGGMNGIVFQEMREARGLAYNASAWYAYPRKKGQFESYFTHIITQNDKMTDCIKEFHNILNDLPASDNAFKIAKEGLTKQLASLRVTKMGIINRWHDMQYMGLDYDLNQKIYNDLKNVTLQDIVNFEKQNMADKQYRYIILGDYKQLDMKALEKIGPVKHLTTEEVFGY